MPATGHLAKISRKKYGARPDHRKAGLTDLFNDLSHFWPNHYRFIRRMLVLQRRGMQVFPKAIVNQYNRKKSSVAGKAS